MFNIRARDESAYVVTGWWAQPQPDQRGSYIHIAGRQEGLWGWLLTTLGIVQRLEFVVSAEKATARIGQTMRVVTLRHVSSTYFSYHRPNALLFVALAFLPFGLVTVGLAWLVSAAFAFLWWTRKRMHIEIAEMSGVRTGFTFKPGVLTDTQTRIDPALAVYVIELLQYLVDEVQVGSGRPGAAVAAIEVGSTGPVAPGPVTAPARPVEPQEVAIRSGVPSEASGWWA